jgi:hypothetical protein
MKVEVQLVNENGRALPTRERAIAPKYRGALHLREARVHSLGRIVPMAELSSVADTNEPSLVPALLEAKIVYLHDSQMRIRGFELVQGVQYGQTWDVKVLPC